MNEAMLEQLLKLDHASSVSLQVQLRQQIAQAILRGSFASDKPLPSSRKLAKQLGVARNTIVLAYEHLEDDGYLIARERRGYFINPEVLKWRFEVKQSDVKAEPSEVPDWVSILKTNQRHRRNIEKPQEWQSVEYPFIYGQFDTDLFPLQNWRECCRDSISEMEVRHWAPDHIVDDDPLLIQEIRTRILPRRGIWADEDEILITVGTQQGLYLLCKMLLWDKSQVGIENPGYRDIRNIALSFDARVKPLAIDGSGLIVNDDLDDCDCVYTTPSHQSPTTVTLPLERRQRLLDKASEHNFMVIEDDYEAETSFAIAHTPALKSLDSQGRVVYVGSFSKILAPGLRLGYLVASKEVIAEANALRRLMVRHPSSNNQRSVALFIARGYYDALAARTARTYETRWNAMREALNHYLPESSIAPTFGGSSYWVAGPESLNVNELQVLARQHSLILEPGDIHYFTENPPNNEFRLGYSSIKSERIEPGIKLLSQLIERLSS